MLAFAATTYTAFLLSPDNKLRALAQSCNLPSRQKLPTDFTNGALPLLDNTLCTTMGFFKANTAKRLNVGLFSIMIAFTLPLSYRLSFQAASPNRKSLLNSGVFLVPLNIIGAAAGVGPWSCLFYTFVYLPAAYSSMKTSKASVLPVPTPSSNIYIANLVHVLFGTTVALAVFADPEGALWHHAALAIQFAGLSYLPIAWLSLRTPKVNDEVESRSVIRRFDAEGVSYAFERTWSYYRKMAAFSAFIYWYGLNRIIRGVWVNGERLDAFSYFWFGDVGGVALHSSCSWQPRRQRSGTRMLSTPSAESPGRLWIWSATRPSPRRPLARRGWKRLPLALLLHRSSEAQVLLRACGGAAARKSWAGRHASLGGKPWPSTAKRQSKRFLTSNGYAVPLSGGRLVTISRPSWRRHVSPRPTKAPLCKSRHAASSESFVGLVFRSSIPL